MAKPVYKRVLLKISGEALAGDTRSSLYSGHLLIMMDSSSF